MKHGGLSNTAGARVDAWPRAATGPERRFAITWREDKGPPVAAPTYRGYGRIVIEESSLHAARECGAGL